MCMYVVTHMLQSVCMSENNLEEKIDSVPLPCGTGDQSGHQADGQNINPLSHFVSPQMLFHMLKYRSDFYIFFIIF